MTGRTQTRARSRAQALVEFALVIPIFLMLLFGIVDLSRYVYSNNSLNEVAREAARQGTVALRPAVCSGLTRVACIQTLAKGRLTAVPIELVDVKVTCQRPPLTDAQLDDPTFENCGTSWRANDIVRVTIQSNLNLVTPLLVPFIGDAPLFGEARVTVSG